MSEDATTTQVSIRLDGLEPLRGVVRSDGVERSQAFVGWLGLLKVLEGSISPESASEDSRSSRTLLGRGKQHV